jgi:hypothetical protein
LNASHTDSNVHVFSSTPPETSGCSRHLDEERVEEIRSRPRNLTLGAVEQDGDIGVKRKIALKQGCKTG